MDARKIWANVLTVVIAIVGFWLVQSYLYKPFKVPTGSMRSTLACGDRVFVQRFGSVDHQDVVVFYPPREPSAAFLNPEDLESLPTNTDTGHGQTYIKRAIGLAGDTVEIKGGRAYINGEPLDEPYLHDDRSPDTSWGPVTVPKDSYLMLGDNRDFSSDGRTFGFVHKNRIVGVAKFTYWPVKNIGPMKQGQAHDTGSVGSGCA